MRPIDADALMGALGIKEECDKCQFNRFRCSRSSDFVGACEAITDAPTIDAVSVVRCGECKYRETCEQIVWFDIGKYQAIGSDIDFCSYGKRE